MKKGIIFLLSVVTGVMVGGGTISHYMEKSIMKNSKLSDKHLALFLMMNQWVKVKQEGKNLSDYFEKKEYKRIAIYGMSYAGETLLDELCETDVEVVYAIDKNASSIYLNIDTVTMESDLQEVDAVVVTAITFYDEIKEKLEEKLKCPIVSLEDILFEV